MMQRLQIATVSLALATAFPAVAAVAQQNGSIELFNGENLDGWYVSVADEARQAEQDIFTVEDGVIHVYGRHEANSPQPFAGLITEKSYGNYHLHLEYKWGEKKFAPRDDSVRDGGIFFHVHGSDRIWPNGVHFQIQEGDTGDMWVFGTKVSSRVHRADRNYSPDGSLVTRGSIEQRFSRFHRAYCWERPGWNHVEIIADGSRAVFKVNGHIVNEAINIMQWDAVMEGYVPLDRGKILLEAEGSEVFYRNIRLEPLESQ